MSESDLQNSSDHREKGLLSPRGRYPHLRRIIKELRCEGLDAVKHEEISGAQDLCYRLFCADVSEQMAAELGVTRSQIRIALNNALKWELCDAKEE